ncbi:MAG: hypothetical protein ACKVW3_12800 [Phycisphaerales bacterium]
MRARRVGEVIAACAATAAGLAQTAHAQENIICTLTWAEVLAGSNVPVPTPNGVIEPGEGVRISVKATITPGIGSTATYTPPPPPGVGTIAGFGFIYLDLIQTHALGGTWSHITRNAAANPGGIPGGGNWTIGSGGSPQMDGSLTALLAGQFVLPGTAANSVNPVQNLWRGTWTPSSYSPRTASFQSERAINGEENSGILIQYGVDPSGAPLYAGKFVPSVMGNTGPIPIVPGPGGLVLLAMGAATAGSRRWSVGHRREVS